MAARLAEFVTDQWSADLIRGWNEQGWWELPIRLGDRIGDLIGAGPGQIAVGDTTTIMLHKLVAGALALRPDRRTIVTHTGNFPTDRHVIDAIAAAAGATVIAVASGELIEAIDGDTAMVVATHVDFRSSFRLDMGSITAAAHGAGAVVVWDLCHTAGAMDCSVDADGVDLAVGCTYKYLNGGPGSPAFGYVAARHLAEFRNPLPGWIGHADPFSMDERYRPAADIRKLLSGTPPVIALTALAAALDAFEGVDMAELRRHSVALTDRFIAGADDRLAEHGFRVATPRRSCVRGSHVSLAHDQAYAITQAAIAAGIVGDYRDPNLCRFGFPPLHITLDDVDEAVDRLVEVMNTDAWQAPAYRQRLAVT